MTASINACITAKHATGICTSTYATLVHAHAATSNMMSHIAAGTLDMCIACTRVTSMQWKTCTGTMSKSHGHALSRGIMITSYRRRHMTCINTASM